MSEGVREGGREGIKDIKRGGERWGGGKIQRAK